MAKNKLDLGDVAAEAAAFVPDLSGVEPLEVLPSDAFTTKAALEKIAACEQSEYEKGQAELARVFGADYVPGTEADRLRQLLRELAKRRCQGLNLYEPFDEQIRFHRSVARIRTVIGSNRSGKTLVAAVEVARALTGTDPHRKYPAGRGRCYAVGKNLDHVGQVMWRKLSRAECFRMIRDEYTGEWRAWRPWLLYDISHVEKTKWAPPLIRPSLVKKVAWENKAKSIPRVVVMHNGWELSFFSGEGKPPQGVDLDLCWMDEEIPDEDWFPEMRARLLDRHGRLVWSATPESGTDVLYDLHEKAEREAHRGGGSRVQEFVLLLADNPYISEAEKEEFAADLTDEQRRVKVGGDFAVTGYKIYPSFSMSVHGVDWPDGGIPDHWTRYASIDPGHGVCAVLFGAVPPREEGDYLYLYDELYVTECDALKFAEEMRQRCVGQRFEAFIIDQRGSVKSEVATGKTILEQYTEALRNAGVWSSATAHGFRLGSDDVDAGLMAVRSWMASRRDGTTRLRVFRDRLPWFEWEMKRYHRKRVAGTLKDRPRDKNDHLMDALRYLVMANPRWVAPREGPRRAGGARAAFDAFEKKSRKGGNAVRLGPGRKYA